MGKEEDLSLFDKIRDYYYTENQIPIKDVEILEASKYDEYSFIAKLKIQGKIYLSIIRYDGGTIIALD